MHRVRRGTIPDSPFRMKKTRTVQVVIGAALLAVTAGCSRPRTDIVATVSEDVGHWDMVNAQEQGQRLTADVCMERAGSAAEVSERLLMQLRKKSYDQVELTMYGRDGQDVQVQKVSWTAASGKQMQQGGAASQNPCVTEEQREQELRSSTPAAH
jgi:hypothetical protein